MEFSFRKKIDSESVLSVIVPVYNEEKTISCVIDELLKRKEVAEIIVIDDASTDNSVEKIQPYLKDKKIKLLTNSQNMGKGSAIRKGFEDASSAIVIVQDADLEYSPNDFPALLEPILSGKADVVYGSRFQGGPGRVLYYKHELGNKFITFLSNLFSDLNFTDIETCYKVFRREIIQNINLESNRFGIEVEITAKISKIEDLRIFEVPISYNGRTYKEGKKITWKDGLAALWFIIKYNSQCKPKKLFKKPWSKL